MNMMIKMNKIKHTAVDCLFWLLIWEINSLHKRDLWCARLPDDSQWETAKERRTLILAPTLVQATTTKSRRKIGRKSTNWIEMMNNNINNGSWKINARRLIWRLVWRLMCKVNQKWRGEKEDTRMNSTRNSNEGDKKLFVQSNGLGGCCCQKDGRMKTEWRIVDERNIAAQEPRQERAQN